MSPQDQWMKAALDVVVDIGETVAGGVARALPGNGSRDQVKAGGQPPVNNGGTKAAGPAAPTTPVVDVQPNNLKMDQAQTHSDNQTVKDSEALIGISAEQKVRATHREMHDLLGRWFRHDGREAIDKMPDGPGGVTSGLVTALVGGITGVIGVVFPEAAAEMSALNALESAGQTGPVGDKKDEANILKGEATKLMNRIADEAEKKVDIGRDKAFKAIPAIIQKLKDSAYDKFADRNDENVEFLALQVVKRWGTYADPGILNKLETRLQKILTLKIKQEELHSKVTKGKMSRGDAEQELKKSEKDFDRAHPGGETKPPAPAPHVTAIDTPIVVHGKDDPLVKDPGVRLRNDLNNVNHTEKEVINAAVSKVTTEHMLMQDRINNWFRKDSHATIDAMPDGEGDMISGTGKALIWGMKKVIGLAFPEVGELLEKATSALESLEQMYSKQRKEKAASLKEQAKGFMIQIAEQADKQIISGMDNATKNAIPPIVQKLKKEAYDKFVDLNPDVESLASQVARGWGRNADPDVLNKLEANLHKVLLMRIKHAELSEKVDKGKISADEASREQAEYQNEIDPPPPYTVDTTRPDYPRGADPHTGEEYVTPVKKLEPQTD